MSTAPVRARHKKSYFLALSLCSNLRDDCEMSWPQRRGQTTQGRPLLIGVLCCLQLYLTRAVSAANTRQMFCQLQI